MPQFTATFVPGGFDDYYMPEVVAPAPQRYVVACFPHLALTHLRGAAKLPCSGWQASREKSWELKADTLHWSGDTQGYA